ncbi:hypothetical protein JRC49_09225 [Clostridiales bacterium FE2011]|nr:hypothetical protein JRC49_09225 [Clostridiales bacterium FE2011]QTE73924.1 hypothetical protein JS518_13675 [Clostridiales bacterium FE2010]
MRIDTFGLPVPVKYRDTVKKQIPPSFRRPDKTEAREQEMEKLRKIYGFQTMSEQEIEERAARIWKKFTRKVGWDKEEEKEK